MSLIDLSGRVAVVTGGSRGIGAATALLLGAAGATVAITYRTRHEDAERVLDALRQSRGKGSGDPVAIQADLARRDASDAVVDQTLARFGRLDCFVANAGIWPAEDVGVRTMDDARWSRTIAVNLDSVFFGCRAALNAMEARGTIVVVASTAAQRGEAYHADYAATKGAVVAFVKSLAVEAAPHVTVNVVAPGWVDTEMCRVPFENEGGAGRRAIERGIPLGRVASADDIAGPIVFLCSDLARHITGEVLNVNGGAVLCG